MSFFEDIKAAKMIGGGGGTPAPTLITKSITSNGSYSASDDSADGYSQVSVDVPNSYSAGDEGKVVQSGALVAQTATSTTTNGTIDTTTNNSIVVNVANSYSAADEGKVVSNGALVAQTSDTVTENGTVDTTLISSLLVNVQGGGGVNQIAKLTTTDSHISSLDMYIVETSERFYAFGAFQSSTAGAVTLNIPSDFDISKMDTMLCGARKPFSSTSPVALTFSTNLQRELTINNPIAAMALYVLCISKST